METKNLIESTLEHLNESEYLDLEEGSAPVREMHSSRKLVSLEEFLPKPLRLSASLLFNDVSGFISYIDQYKQETTALFANERHFEVIFDFHSKETPSWCEHRAVYNLAHTIGWKTWTDQHGKRMSQEQFAEFIEDNIEFVQGNSAGELLSAVKTFKATTSKRLVSVLNDNGSEASLEFKRETNASGASESVSFPKEISILLKPFEGLERVDEGKNVYQVAVRLKYQLNNEGTGVTFSYHLVGIDKIRRMAYDSLVQFIEDRTGVTTFVGGSLNK